MVSKSSTELILGGRGGRGGSHPSVKGKVAERQRTPIKQGIRPGLEYCCSCCGCICAYIHLTTNQNTAAALRGYAQNTLWHSYIPTL